MKNNYKITSLKLNDGQNEIYNNLYIPSNYKKGPIVIYSHELANTHEIAIPYAEFLANNNIASLIFDYPGGSNESKSSGSTLDMTISGQVKTLSYIIDEVKKLEYIDKDNIFVIGASQGGLVSSLVAAKKEKDIRSLVLMYPGFNIYDGFHETFNSLEEVPDTFSFKGWIELSKKYVEDIWYHDPYEIINKYKRPVLLLHGNEDKLVPLKYSIRALETYENADLIILQASHHIFVHESINKACRYIIDFINQNKKV